MLHPFEVVAEPVRRRIVEILAGGSHQAGVLTDAVTAEFGISRAAVSHHLRILRESGVVFVTPVFTERHYDLESEFLDRLDHAVGELFAVWDHRYGFASPNMPVPPVLPSRIPHGERARTHRARPKGRRGAGGRPAWNEADI